MRAEGLAVRNWDCRNYCQTQENCAFACGLEPPPGTNLPAAPTLEKDTYFRFLLNPHNVVKKITSGV